MFAGLKHFHRTPFMHGAIVTDLAQAPERDAGGAVTRMLTDKGIVVAAGHSDTTLDQLETAIDHGLALFTHLGNACPAMIPRHDNIVQRVLSVSDRLSISFIADGHHRYETALNYRRQLIESGEIDSDQHPANSVLMMFVGMSDPGLAILPTHRLISDLPSMSQAEIIAALENNFKLTPMGTGSQAAQETWEAIEMNGNQSTLGFGTASDQQWLLAELTDGSPMAELAAEQSDEWRELGVSLLHKLVLEYLIPKHFSGSELSWKYVHLMSEVNESITDQTCQLAALVPPAGIEHVQEIASNLEKMPPKSTFFYPKLLSGLVFNPLK